MAKVSLRGDKQLRQNLRDLGQVFSPRQLDAAIKDALDPLVGQTEANARSVRDYAGKYPGFPEPKTPRRGGHLDEGVQSRLIAGSATKRTWWVAFARRARKLAHLVEFGTSPHFQPRFRRGYAHPGARPHPFFRPAFEARKHDVLATLRQRVEARLLAIAARLRK